ncbi:hypothetical protein [Falsirhodobacter sp. 20TX0035]|uniref:hypothetical protein n=1 Tax=Falsirhodobacter sp. 20TX0035 TaxID=3022019 RepID=UPI0023304C57|nr:hypothetical protein [Falsirhodobacter sp. 20TX0035]MDB6453547.1 hypothetical protein [Falsirhodobacter sp. 20TX0035]
MTDRPVQPQTDDVLRSIRRLTAGAPVEGASLPPLLLTPELRVHPDRTPAVADVHDRLAPIDEEVLHDLVRELLSEELQGPFGEKITRNIRMMVRAEIGRALAERDLK